LTYTQKTKKLFVLNGNTSTTNEQVDESIQEIWQMFRETDRRFEELGKEIGGLGRKFGWFTEGMVLPSMERILTEKFEMEYISLID